MPIIALVLSTLAFWIFYWFVRMGGIDHIRASSEKRKEEAGRAAARERERTTCLRAVEDPREAATILMLLMARVGGDPTKEHITAIERLIRVTFGFEQELRERMTAARFIASRAEGFEQAAGLFSDLFNARLTSDERQELIGMLEEIAAVEGPCPAHNEAIELVKRRIGLASAR
jgi:uncharacterized tellurite resistance protein B-like protein